MGYLRHVAHRIVGGDYTYQVLRNSHEYYDGHIPLVRLDAQSLPFREDTFDTIILFEAIYYLFSAESFFRESARILKPGGKIIINTVNKEWEGFSPSPHSIRYFSAKELLDVMRPYFQSVEIFGGFSSSPRTTIQRMIASVRRVAVHLKLFPQTLKGREWLKRMFYGSLTPLPKEIFDGMAEVEPLTRLNGGDPVHGYKVLYAIGCLRQAANEFVQSYGRVK